MANPNLLGITNVTGVTTNILMGTSGVGTGFQTVLSNASSSGKVYKVITILATNKTKSKIYKIKLKNYKKRI
mgnify:CR=1 FL=1